MGFNYDADKQHGFAILDRFGSIWSRTLYRTEEQAREALLGAGFNETDISKLFTIARASFTISTSTFDEAPLLLPKPTEEEAELRTNGE